MRTADADRADDFAVNLNHDAACASGVIRIGGDRLCQGLVRLASSGQPTGRVLECERRERVGFAAGDIPKIPLNLTLLKGCSIVGVFWGDWARREPTHFAEAMARLDRWYADGKLKPHISATFPLERAADALTLMASRKVTGKVVLTAG